VRTDSSLVSSTWGLTLLRQAGRCGAAGAAAHTRPPRLAAARCSSPRSRPPACALSAARAGDGGGGRARLRAGADAARDRPDKRADGHRARGLQRGRPGQLPGASAGGGGGADGGAGARPGAAGATLCGCGPCFRFCDVVFWRPPLLAAAGCRAWGSCSKSPRGAARGVLACACACAQGAPFVFDRESVRIEAPSRERPEGVIFLSGTWRRDNVRYQVGRHAGRLVGWSVGVSVDLRQRKRAMGLVRAKGARRREAGPGWGSQRQHGRRRQRRGRRRQETGLWGPQMGGPCRGVEFSGLGSMGGAEAAPHPASASRLAARARGARAAGRAAARGARRGGRARRARPRDRARHRRPL
jgi:hypothetical protein